MSKAPSLYVVISDPHDYDEISILHSAHLLLVDALTAVAALGPDEETGEIMPITITRCDPLPVERWRRFGRRGSFSAFRDTETYHHYLRTPEGHWDRQPDPVVFHPEVTAPGVRHERAIEAAEFLMGVAVESRDG